MSKRLRLELRRQLFFAMDVSSTSGNVWLRGQNNLPEVALSATAAMLEGVLGMLGMLHGAWWIDQPRAFDPDLGVRIGPEVERDRAVHFIHEIKVNAGGIEILSVSAHKMKSIFNRFTWGEGSPLLGSRSREARGAERRERPSGLRYWT